jgi:hypothetical protein
VKFVDRTPKAGLVPSILAVLCLTPVIGILVGTKSGLGIAGDSTTYLAAGVRLASGQGLTTIEGRPLTVFPPGLPLLIATGETLGLDPNVTVRVLNSVSMVAVVLLTYVLLRRHVSSLPLALGGTALTAASPWLLSNADFILTEPPFIAISLAFIVAMENLLERPESRRAVLSSAALVWLAFAFKYAALAFIPIGIAALLIKLWRTDRQLAAKQAMFFTAGALILPGGWMLRNIAISGTSTGGRSSSAMTPGTSGFNTLETVGKWLVSPTSGKPVSWAAPLSDPILALIGGVALLALGFAVWRFRSEIHQHPAHKSIVPLVSFTVGYAAILWTSSLRTHLEPIANRLLSPIYVPLLVIAAIAVDQFLSTAGRNTKVMVSTALAGCLALQIFSFASTADFDSRGRGFAAANWRNSDMIAQVAKLPDDAVIYTNELHPVWLHTRRDSLRRLPGAGFRDSIRLLSETAACEKTYLALFDGPRRNLLGPAELEAYVDLEVISEQRDGSLFRMTGKSALERPCRDQRKNNQ